MKKKKFVSMMDDGNREYGTFMKVYNERMPLYKKAVVEAKKTLEEIKKKHEKDSRLRIAYIDGRVKSASSIIRKAYEKEVSGDEVFKAIEDIVGLRVVVNNLKDIEPMINELEAHPRFTVIERKEHNDRSPYKATHIKVSYSSPENGDEHTVILDLQIRSLLQDAWAVLTHHDVYRNQASLPPLAVVISKYMSQAFSALDHLADNFRAQIEAEVEPPNDLSDDAPLDKQGVAFLYYETFGQKPQEYEVEFLMRKVAEYGVHTVGQARKGLSKDVLEELKKIHDSRFGMITGHIDLFEYGVLYASKGPSAFRDYKNKIEEDWMEIEAIGRAEVLSEMPDTLEEFIEIVKCNDVPWQAIRELGGIRDCLRCGVDILVSDTAAEAIMDHYGFPDIDVDLEYLLFNAGGYGAPEQESVNTSGLCPWCDHIASKDD